MTLERDNVEIEMTVFSRDYVNNLDKLFVGNELELKGKVGVYKGKKNFSHSNTKLLIFFLSAEKTTINIFLSRK